MSDSKTSVTELNGGGLMITTTDGQYVSGPVYAAMNAAGIENWHRSLEEVGRITDPKAKDEFFTRSQLTSTNFSEIQANKDGKVYFLGNVAGEYRTVELKGISQQEIKDLVGNIQYDGKMDSTEESQVQALHRRALGEVKAKLHL